MPNINLSMLNQKATPSFYADTLANRPAPSYVGRIFVSTDTLDLYRDTGTAWVLLSPSSTGTITGSGAAGQVTIFSGASSITGTNNLFWDTTNLRLGINNNTPGASLDVHSATGIVAQLNVTTATNNTELAFQNAGTGKWRIGNSYNAGANDFQVYDVVNSLQRFSVLNTGQTFVGAQTSSSGKLVVNQTASDNGIVLIGTTAPSIRVRNLGVAPTQQFGLGLSTGVNNFIQGSASGDFCIFNGSTTASPITFGVYDAGAGNIQEAARFSASRNFLIGRSTDAGYKLDVNGTLRASNSIYADGSINVAGGVIGNNSNNLYLSSGSAAGEISFWANQLNTRLMTLNSSGALGLGVNSGLWDNTILPIEVGNRGGFYAGFNGASTSVLYVGTNAYYNSGWKIANTSIYDPQLLDMGDGNFNFQNSSPGTAGSPITWNSRLFISNTGNVGIGNTTPVRKLDVNGVTRSTAFDVFNNSALSGFLIQEQLWVGGSSTNISIAAETGNAITFYTNGSATQRAQISTSGNLLIGTTTDNGYKLQVAGNAILSSSGAAIAMDGRGSGNSGAKVQLLGWSGVLNNWEISTALYTGGGLDLAVSSTAGGSTFTTAIGTFNQTTGVYTALSDINKKKNFEQSNLGLNAILKLKPTLYNMISQNDNEAKELGFIAQEVKEVIEQAYIENGEFIGLNYQAIVATLVKAIQELNTKIENLK